MTLWLAIVALVLFVNEWIAPMAIVVETAACHVDDNEEAQRQSTSARAAVEQAGPASVLVFLVRPPRSNPPPTREPGTETPSEVLPTCNSALRAPKSERARASHHLFALQDTRTPIAISKAMATLDDRPPLTENRRPTREP